MSVETVTTVSADEIEAGARSLGLTAEVYCALLAGMPPDHGAAWLKFRAMTQALYRGEVERSAWDAEVERLMVIAGHGDLLWMVEAERLEAWLHLGRAAGMVSHG